MAHSYVLPIIAFHGKIVSFRSMLSMKNYIPQDMFVWFLYWIFQYFLARCVTNNFIYCGYSEFPIDASDGKLNSGGHVYLVLILIFVCISSIIMENNNHEKARGI